MNVENNHLKEAMVDLNGKLTNKNKEIDDMKAFMSGLKEKQLREIMRSSKKTKRFRMLKQLYNVVSWKTRTLKRDQTMP